MSFITSITCITWLHLLMYFILYHFQHFCRWKMEGAFLITKLITILQYYSIYLGWCLKMYGAFMFLCLGCALAILMVGWNILCINFVIDWWTGCDDVSNKLIEHLVHHITKSLLNLLHKIDDKLVHAAK